MESAYGPWLADLILSNLDSLARTAVTTARAQVPWYRGLPPDQLHLLPERHIRCNPALAQYIVAPAFPPVICEGFFAKMTLDPAFVAAEEARVTRGWQRLQEIPSLGLAIIDYPL